VRRARSTATPRQPDPQHTSHTASCGRGGGRTRTRPLPVCEGRGADGPQAAVWAGTTARLPGTHRRVHKQGHPDGGSVPAPRGSRGGGTGGSWSGRAASISRARSTAISAIACDPQGETNGAPDSARAHPIAGARIRIRITPSRRLPAPTDAPEEFLPPPTGEVPVSPHPTTWRLLGAHPAPTPIKAVWARLGLRAGDQDARTHGEGAAVEVHILRPRAPHKPRWKRHTWGRRGDQTDTSLPPRPGVDRQRGGQEKKPVPFARYASIASFPTDRRTEGTAGEWGARAGRSRWDGP